MSTHLYFLNLSIFLKKSDLFFQPFDPQKWLESNFSLQYPS